MGRYIGDDKNVLEVHDENFEEVSKSVNDGIGTILANVGIAVAEQKKLLQSAKTPLTLQNALKLIAVTAGNLIGAGNGMLGWMGRRLNKRDSFGSNSLETPEDVFLSYLTGTAINSDKLFENSVVVYGATDGDYTYSIVHRTDIDDYVIVMSGKDGSNRHMGIGIEDYEEALDELFHLIRSI